jgi:hypothetical protein
MDQLGLGIEGFTQKECEAYGPEKENDTVIKPFQIRKLKSKMSTSHHFQSRSNNSLSFFFISEDSISLGVLPFDRSIV